MVRDWFEDAEQDPIHAAAADWFTRLQHPLLSLEDATSWQTWMSADERHAHAYRRMEETWQRFQEMPAPALVSARALAGDRYDGAIPVSQWKPAVGHERRHLKFAVAASVAVVAVVSALGLKWIHGRAEISPAGLLETAVGENRTVTLADGSTIAIGADTQIEVALGSDSRRLTLTRGEAFFTVAKDPSRPFSVHAGSATLTALGTAFNVRRADSRVVVAVIEGQVLLRPRLPIMRQLPILRDTTPKKRRPQALNAGDQTAVSEAGIESSSRLTDPVFATAWQSGRLTFEGEPLRYVLSDVNRYSPKAIETADDTIANLRITGTVLSDNIDGWLGSLERAFGIHAEEEPDRIVLRRKDRT